LNWKRRFYQPKNQLPSMRTFRSNSNRNTVLALLLPLSKRCLNPYHKHC